MATFNIHNHEASESAAGAGTSLGALGLAFALGVAGAFGLSHKWQSDRDKIDVRLPKVSDHLSGCIQAFSDGTYRIHIDSGVAPVSLRFKPKNPLYSMSDREVVDVTGVRLEFNGSGPIPQDVIPSPLPSTMPSPLPPIPPVGRNGQ